MQSTWARTGIYTYLKTEHASLAILPTTNARQFRLFLTLQAIFSKFQLNQELLNITRTASCFIQAKQARRHTRLLLIQRYTATTQLLQVQHLVQALPRVLNIHAPRRHQDARIQPIRMQTAARSAAP